MKIKRAPLLGVIGILIITLLFITISMVKTQTLNQEPTEEPKTEVVVQEEPQATEAPQKATATPKPIPKTTPKPTPKVTTTPIPETIPQPSTSSTSLGQFKITAYCSCSKCCGQWAGGKTASGTTPTAGRTIATDPRVIPLGTKVIIDGHTYVAEDTGGAIKGQRIDIYFNSHSEALAWGVQHKAVSME